LRVAEPVKEKEKLTPEELMERNRERAKALRRQKMIERGQRPPDGDE